MATTRQWFGYDAQVDEQPPRNDYLPFGEQVTETITEGPPPSNSIRYGANAVDDFKLGSSQVDKVYLGADQLFPPT